MKASCENLWRSLAARACQTWRMDRSFDSDRLLRGFAQAIPASEQNALLDRQFDHWLTAPAFSFEFRVVQAMPDYRLRYESGYVLLIAHVAL